MPHLDVPGAAIHYEAAGHPSAPALLLVHAGIATLRMWDSVVPALAEQHFVIRYDTRGFGETVSDDVEFSNRADARGILSHLGVERATVIGASRGGQIATDLALESPDRVAGLVLVCSGVGGAPDVENTDTELRLDALMTEAEHAGRFDELVDLEVRLWAIGPTRDAAALDQRFVQTAFALNRANLPRLGENAPSVPLEPPAYARLDEVAAPALVIVGDHDITDAQFSYDLLTARIPDATGARMPRSAHLPSVEHPEDFVELVTAWLGERHL